MVWISIENYRKGWEPVRLESYFADVLRTDPRLLMFSPREQPPNELSSADKMINIVGAASRLFLGVGYYKEMLPHKILLFSSCPVTTALLVNHSGNMNSRFVFNVPPDFDPKDWKSEGELTIWGRGPGFMGSGDRSQITIFNSAHADAPGLQSMSTDLRLHSTLLEMIRTDLILGHNLKVSYPKEMTMKMGVVQVQVRNSFKAWKIVMQSGLNPQEFVVNLFGAVVTIVRHVQSQLLANHTPQTQFQRRPFSTPPRQAMLQQTTTSAMPNTCSNCRAQIQPGANFCPICGMRMR